VGAEFAAAQYPDADAERTDGQAPGGGGQDRRGRLVERRFDTIVVATPIG
jgi:hypothetical protein